MANDPIISTSGITGSDGITPIYDPDGRFQIWNKDEIFMGPTGPGDKRYVPKIGDMVVQKRPLLWYEVTNIDLATLVPTLDELPQANSGGDPSDEDLLLGPGPGTPSDTYRVYLDTSVVPHAMRIDARCYIRGSDNMYARLFLGSDISDESKIISLQYDSTGNIIGNKIPLEMAEIDNVTNISTKIMPTSYTMRDIPDDERVTFVSYAGDNRVTSKRQLILENSAFIAAANISTKYITGISLKCPFLSASDPRRIDLPQNVLLSGLNMIGVVHYSDGSTVELPVDGTKFKLLGIESYLTTVVGHQAGVILRYQLSQNEISYGNQVGAVPFISEEYKVVTAQEDNAYSVKLYGYPVWQNSVSGYTLRWFLYNALRDVMYDVTNQVEYSPAAAPFNPTLYGVLQTVVVGVNLQAVNGSYRNYRHTQTEQLVLWGEGTMRTTNWTILFDQNQNPPYGPNLHADLTFVNYNYYKLKFGTGAATKQEWLQRLYYDSKPLIDQFKEQTPPAPTHFRIKVGTQEFEYSVDAWNDEVIVGSGLNDNDTLYIYFISKNPITDLQLSVAALPVYLAGTV